MNTDDKPPEPTTAVAVRESGPNPLAMIGMALEKGMPPDQLGKLYDLAERHEKNVAAQVFADAITAFQAECPAIPKGRAVKNKQGYETYKFCNYDDISEVIAPILARHRIVVTFDSMPAEGMLLVTCRVRVGTHTEASGATVPIPAAGQMTNDTQALGSALSYGKRYAIGLALNIRFTGEDDDGQSSTGRRPQQHQQPAPQPPPPPGNGKAAVTIDLPWVLTYCGKPTPPDNQSLAERCQFLGKHLKRLFKDFDPAEVTEAITEKLGEDWHPETITPAQRQLAWVAVGEWVRGEAASRKQAAAA